MTSLLSARLPPPPLLAMTAIGVMMIHWPGMLLQPLSAAVTRYDGDQVREIAVKDVEHWKLVLGEIRSFGPNIEVWRQPVFDVDRPSAAHVYVPRTLTDSFGAHLDALGLAHRVLIDDVQRLVDDEYKSNTKTARFRLNDGPETNTEDSIVGKYPTYEELTAWLHNLTVRFEDAVSLQTIGRSAQGRELFVLKISANRSDSRRRPAVWIDAGIHAREWISVSTIVYIINTIVKSVRAGPDDDRTSVVRRVDWYIAPLLNPDGYAFTHQPDGNRMWRKNRVLYKDTGFSTFYNQVCFGVDLNRNFDFKWGTGRSALKLLTEQNCFCSSLEPHTVCVQRGDSRNFILVH